MTANTVAPPAARKWPQLNIRLRPDLHAALVRKVAEEQAATGYTISKGQFVRRLIEEKLAA